MKRLWMLFSLVLLLPSLVAYAQECIAVSQAAQALETLCQITGRNQICYGSAPFEAAAQPGFEGFALNQPGDISDVTLLNTLRVSSSDAGWGTALMRLQANLPNSDPNQNVTVVALGGVELQNDVQAVDLPVEVGAVAVGQLNIRSQPSVNGGLIGGLFPGTSVSLVGRLPDNSWGLIRIPGSERETGWVNIEIGALNFEGDITELDVIGAESELRAMDVRPEFAPLQIFRFDSAVSSTCEDAPSGLLIQTPDEVGQVTLTVNGVSLHLSATAFLQAQPGGEMIVNVLEGRVRVAAGNSAVTAPAGTLVRVAMDTALNPLGTPSAPEPYDEAAMRALPLTGLQHEVTVAAALPAEQAALGEGEVQVTLSWDNAADLDLYVKEPNGGVLYYAEPQSATGGQLDVDSNQPCGENPGSVENVFWPQNAAPEGSYEVYVQQYDECGAGDANWTLTVRVDGQDVLVQRGTGGPSVFEFFR